MKKLLLAAVAVLVTAFSANAQVKIESPHPDLNIKITRCAYASGTVVIDMVITNFGTDEKLQFRWDEITAYDDEGNQYSSRNSDIKYGFPSNGLTGWPVDLEFPQDVPLKFRIQFPSINADASKFVLAKIGIRSYGAMALDMKKPLIIRNLEWEK